MRSWISTLVLYTISTASFAGITCGYLNITINNTTGQNCTLQNSVIYNGSLGDIPIPSTIANGQMTQSFTLEQSYIGGPSLLLEYRCGTENISFVSSQDFCFLSAGNIIGQVEVANNMNAQYASIIGSFWSKLPGQINWTLTS